MKVLHTFDFWNTLEKEMETEIPLLTAPGNALL
jgi:hypothetical protein